MIGESAIVRFTKDPPWDQMRGLKLPDAAAWRIVPGFLFRSSGGGFDAKGVQRLRVVQLWTAGGCAMDHGLMLHDAA